MSQNKIRTRFAPSPTGKMHVGNLRTALYAYLVAKHTKGDFIIRIEDTDQERLVDGAVALIYKTLDKTGLKHDEGPDLGGDYGPYVQSERQKTGVYLEYAKTLVEKGEAYYCFCDKERLDGLKTGPYGGMYDKHCLGLDQAAVLEKLEQGVPFVIRQNNPTEGKTTFDDEIYGAISVDNSALDDMILMKSDGYPTYNFANVVDDHLMGITHVVRGNEYLSSSPKYNRLYEAFGWEVPIYIHCPLITDASGNKLSKRSGHASYEDLEAAGYLDEAIVNYVALLGWSPPGNEEIYSLETLIELFDYKRMNKSPAVFDMQKFTWMNGVYISQMAPEAFYVRVHDQLQRFLPDGLDLRAIAALIQGRLETLNDIEKMVVCFKPLEAYDNDLYVHKKMKTTLELSLNSLQLVQPVLERVDDFSVDHLHDVVLALAAEKGMKNGQMLWPIRTALSGQPTSPGGAFELAHILGKAETLKRIAQGIEQLSNAVTAV